MLVPSVNTEYTNSVIVHQPGFLSIASSDQVEVIVSDNSISK